MEIEKIVNESKALAKRVHELEGPWDPCALVTDRTMRQCWISS
jgi:hypothetical protein